MSQDIVVAITLGQRDLQVLANGPDGLLRVSPGRHARGAVGRLHQALRGGLPRAFRVPDAESPEGEADFTADGRLIGFTAAEFSDAPGALPLVPGLLGPRLRELNAEVRSGRVRISRVLLLHTDRGPGSRWADGEPVAAAPVLADWFRAHFADQFTVPDAVRVENYAVGSGDLFVRDEFGNNLLRADVANRIDAAVAAAADGGPDTVRVYASAGIPAPNEVLLTSCRYRFAHLRYFSPNEGEAGVPAPGLRHPPAPVLEARRQAVGLLRHGQFQAAEAVLRPFGGSPHSCLFALARYFQGYRTEARDQARSLASTRTGATLLALVDDKPLPECLHVALRAHAALTAGDVLGGAALTATFLDVSILDAVDASLRSDGTVSCVDWPGRHVLLNRSKASRDDLVALLPARKEYFSHLPKEWFATDEFDRWFDPNEVQAGNPAEKAFLILAIRTPGGHTVLADALGQLHRSWYRTESGPGRIQPSSYRNAIIHGQMTQEQIVAMTDLLCRPDRLLWQRGPADSLRFLHPRTRAAAVLAALGVDRPGDFYDELVAAAVADVRVAPIT